MGRRERFVWSAVALSILALALAGFATPPDAYTQVAVLAAAVGAATLGAYLLVYRGGFDRVGIDYGTLPLTVVAAFVGTTVAVAAWRVLRPGPLSPAVDPGVGYAANLAVGALGATAGVWAVATGRLRRPQ